MQEWNLTQGEPLELTLVSDARLVPTDYIDDQIWQVVIGGGEPPALALQTTYGLRARNIRLFPRFTDGETSVTDPAAFFKTPSVGKFYPNYIQLFFSPFEDIDVETEYWVPDSKSISGRFKIINHGSQLRDIIFEWIALLSPNEGVRIAPVLLNNVQVLLGQTSHLTPVVFMTGGPAIVGSPFPGLKQEFRITPGEMRTISWSQAALSRPEDSFSTARKIVARSWDAEITRLEMANSGLLEIYTGDTNWDAALALTQKIAYSLILSPTPSLPNHSFVLCRQPDQGYSFRGDGTDYGSLWNGQTPLETYYLSGLLSPDAVRYSKEWLDNFLSYQQEDGSIDWKMGLAGQRNHLLATPILATIAWKIYQSTLDHQFIERVYPKLLKFFNRWFSPQYDRDADGFPEWNHSMQTGFEDHPIYSPWQTGSPGLAISLVETPLLAAFLFREGKILTQISSKIGLEKDIPDLDSITGRLLNSVQSCWSDSSCSYHSRDRDTHLCNPGGLLGERNGSGAIHINQIFPEPIRLLIHIHTPGEITVHPQLSIFGKDTNGQDQVEQIQYDRFQWHMGTSKFTGEGVYTQLELIEIKGIGSQDSVLVRSADYAFEDQTNLMPIWAGIPDLKQANQLVKKTLTNPKKFWLPYGIPACLNPETSADLAICHSVHMPFNSMIGEGLVDYGYPEISAELVSHLMAGVIKSLKNEHAFHHYYHALTGEGIGEHNVLHGLAPLDLFLKTLGVRFLYPNRVALQGFNPYPWPVTVKYRGVSVLRQQDRTNITFSNGQSTIIDDPTPCTIALE
jgi:hypothetical protein